MNKRSPELTNGQRECLQLVLLHMSSKDIGRALDISPHTVDQRIKGAMRTLGAESRWKAAQILAAREGASDYQRLVYQAPDVATASSSSSKITSGDHGDRHTGETDASVLQEALSVFDVRPIRAAHQLPLPVPSFEGEKNDLTLLQRLGWIVAIATGAALGFGAIMAGLDALADLI